MFPSYEDGRLLHQERLAQAEHARLVREARGQGASHTGALLASAVRSLAALVRRPRPERRQGHERRLA